MRVIENTKVWILSQKNNYLYEHLRSKLKNFNLEGSSTALYLAEAMNHKAFIVNIQANKQNNFKTVQRPSHKQNKKVDHLATITWAQ